jgi:hypothetical protein
MRLSGLRGLAEEEGHTARSLYAAKALLGIIETTDADGRKAWQLPADNVTG